MKFVTFRIRDNLAFGVVVQEGVALLGGLPGARWSGVRDLLENGGVEAATEALRDAPRLPMEGLSYAPVIPDPGLIYCVGMNYAPHVAEMGRDMPTHPAIFVRTPRSQVGHGEPLVVPSVSSQLDYEGELAVVIGRRGRYIAAEAAMDHVAGYACYNDGSVRDFQRHSSQFTPGKNFWATGAFGPFLVTPDETGDIMERTITTRLNGQVMQQAPFTDLIFKIPELIAYMSTFVELKPGDVIVTGTPGGVGVARKPPVFMKPGDTVEVEIGGIGVLRNPVVAEADVVVPGRAA